METPEHRARRRHGRDREARSSSSASRRRQQRDEAVRGVRRRDRSVGTDDSRKVPAALSSPAKKPRLRSEVGEVRGCLWRFEPLSPEEDNPVDVPAEHGVLPTSASSPAPPAADKDNGGAGIFAPDEAAPPKGGAGTAPSSSPAAPPATTTGLFLRQVPVPAPPTLSRQAPSQAPTFTAVAPPPPMPASNRYPTMAKVVPSSSRSRLAYAIPAIPPLLIPAPGKQPVADPDELRRAKVERYAGLIAKKQQETDERYRKLLRSGKAPPEPAKPAVDKETLRHMAARDAARRRFRVALREQEWRARRAGLFVQMARPEHLRALGIDKAMELVVSPDRPRNENGAPVLSPEHPITPLEMLGYFLKTQ